MITIKRIFIEGGNGNCNDRAYLFVRDNLRRRYGNSVTFAGEWEIDDVIKQLADSGFKSHDDGFIIRISTLADYVPGKIVMIDGCFSSVPMKIVSIDGDSARVKYANYPRKRGGYIKIPTEEKIHDDIKKYGTGLFESYLNNIKG